MPNVSLPTGQDWDAVNAGKSHEGRMKKPQTARELDAAKAKGLVATEKRYVGYNRKRSQLVPFLNDPFSSFFPLFSVDLVLAAMRQLTVPQS